ncbi:molybdate-anion transporter [Octopus bimaculoides]|uniref:Molybdate-anion transporter n=1 Tax=Octopus bimaculoides TaxID=37653 RepID=A0A0L8G1E5_OCTBM|nr:molybdate-anion transporter [Octopus bimaculoides]|eukprot:XP_014784952.1 PREDICTED: molybdate-anion transporter-like [Octopus bimaculoides]
MVVLYAVFLVLACLASLLQIMVYRLKKDVLLGNNPQFLKFQRGYFSAYLPAMFADWLQGPYLYKLYNYYGFQEEQIAVLYVFGFASTVLLGTWIPLAADQFGRKKMCILFTVLYSISCLLKLSRNYAVLLLGRLVGGVATSVLFSAFEAWYIHEHTETHDFPKEWIAVTFTKASFWNGVLAILAGLTANIFSEWFGLGPVAPYILAIPFLIFAGVMMSTHWNENYSGHKVNFQKLCFEGLKKTLTHEKVFLIGAIESSYESVIYIIIFLWTPILDREKFSLGIVFSSFMISILIGSGLYQIASSKNVPVTNLLLSSVIIALFANILCVISTNPTHPNTALSFTSFLIFEVGVGLYFPAMGFLRNNIIPETHRTNIMNWFRIPLNLISCIVLLLLHEDVFQHGNRMIFVVCVGLQALALVCSVRFVKIAKEDDMRQETLFIAETEHIHNIF